MKKKIAVLAVFVICVCTAIPVTLAYFTSYDTARNVITTGSVKIRLNEMTLLENGEVVPFENLCGVMPGGQASKIVTVTNTGGNSAYVRLLVSTDITLAQGQNGEVDTSLVGLDLNTADWTRQDGAFYYNHPLEPGEETKPLFTTVTFSPQMDNLYRNSTVSVTVAAQATQTANNGDSALTAAGWPKR